MNIEEILKKKIHFIGIGGVGMFTIAGILLEKGVAISGSDLEDSSKMAKLRSLGATVHIGHNANNVPNDCGFIVFSSAVKDDNPEMIKAKEMNIPTMRRGNFLAELSKTYKRVIAVSGSHGKTSTSALIVHLLKQQNINCGYLIGGELFHGNAFAAGDGDIFVTEADESDGTHTLFEPHIGVITNLDDDHSWSLGGVDVLCKNFQTSAKKSEKFIYFKDEVLPNVFENFTNGIIFNTEDVNRYNYPSNINGYQKKNSFLALKAIELLNLPVNADDLANFENVKRRMNLIKKSENLVIIEDYAHHPKELKNSLKLLRECYNDFKILTVFQVHRAARLNLYFNDFIDILNKYSDEVILARLFEAWLNDSSNYTIPAMAEKINNAQYIEDFNKIAEYLKTKFNNNEKTLVAIIGAGDIQKVIGLINEQ